MEQTKSDDLGIYWATHNGSSWLKFLLITLLLLAILFSILPVSKVLSQAYYTKQSKSEGETPMQYVNEYIWNLERW